LSTVDHGHGQRRPPSQRRFAAGRRNPAPPPFGFETELNRALLMGSLRAPPQLAGGTSLGRGYRPCLASSGVPKSKVLSVSCPMKSYRLSDLSDAEVSGLKARPRIDFTSIFSTVR
uniref:Uncharacterized protein n=1 Tax=Aegilops tauschii subsp. strangulata TaxID=200361 RepID=A0A453BXD9_AEGTS